MIKKISDIKIGDEELKIATKFDLMGEKEKLVFLEKLGQGAAGQVFKCRYNYGIAAVKVMSDRENDLSQIIGSIQKEISLMKVLNHPHLTNYYGYVITDTEVKILMELCEGGDVFNLIHDAKKKISLRQKIKIIYDSAAGLFHLHSKNIIHRDIKSKNVMLKDKVADENSVIHGKLSDYGFSKSVEKNNKLVTVKLGTSQYNAPEIFLTSDEGSQVSGYTLKADIYSFGVYIWEVFCRKVPFKDEKIHADIIKLKVAKEGLRLDLKKLPKDTPEEVRSLIQQCFEQNPEIRPDIANIVEVFEKLLNDLD